MINVGQLVANLDLIDNMSPEMKATVERVAVSLDKMGKDAQATAYQLTLLGRGMTELGVLMSGALTIPILATSDAVIKFGGHFETEMMHVQTLAGTTKAEVDGLRQSVIDLGPATGIGPAELAKGLFVLESYGMRGAEAMDTLNVAAQMSALGMGTTTDAARGLTGILFSYREQHLSAAEAGNLLAQTAALGNVRISELIPAMARVNPVAASLGIKFEDVAAALATFTHAGVDSATAATGIRAMLNNILTDSAKTEKGFLALAKATGDNSLTMDNFVKEIRDSGLTEAMVHLSDKIIKSGDDAIHTFGMIFPNVRALTEALAVYGINGDMVVDILSKMDKNQNTLGIGTEALRQTWQFQWDVMQASIEKVFISLGTSLLPMFKGFVDLLEGSVSVFQSVVDAFNWLHPAAQAFIVALLGIAAVSGPLIIVFGQLFMAIGNIKRGMELLAEGNVIQKIIQTLTSVFFGVTTAATGTAVAVESVGVAGATSSAPLAAFEAELAAVRIEALMAVAAVDGTAVAVTTAGTASAGAAIEVGALAVVEGEATVATGILSTAMAFLAANPIMMTITALAILGTGIILWNRQTEDTSGKVQELSQQTIDHSNKLEALNQKYLTLDPTTKEYKRTIDQIISIAPQLTVALSSHATSNDEVEASIRRVIQADKSQQAAYLATIEAEIAITTANKARITADIEMVVKRTEAFDKNKFSAEKYNEIMVAMGVEYKFHTDKSKELNTQLDSLKATQDALKQSLDPVYKATIEKTKADEAAAKAIEKHTKAQIDLLPPTQLVLDQVKKLTQETKLKIVAMEEEKAPMSDIMLATGETAKVIETYWRQTRQATQEVKAMSKEVERAGVIEQIFNAVTAQGIEATSLSAEEFARAALKTSYSLDEIALASGYSIASLRIFQDQMKDSTKDAKDMARDLDVVNKLIRDSYADMNQNILRSEEGTYASRKLAVENWEQEQIQLLSRRKVDYQTWILAVAAIWADGASKIKVIEDKREKDAKDLDIRMMGDLEKAVGDMSAAKEKYYGEMNKLSGNASDSQIQIANAEYEKQKGAVEKHLQEVKRNFEDHWDGRNQESKDKFDEFNATTKEELDFMRLNWLLTVEEIKKQKLWSEFDKIANSIKGIGSVLGSDLIGKLGDMVSGVSNLGKAATSLQSASGFAATFSSSLSVVGAMISIVDLGWSIFGDTVNHTQELIDANNKAAQELLDYNKKIADETANLFSKFNIAWKDLNATIRDQYIWQAGQDFATEMEKLEKAGVPVDTMLRSTAGAMNELLQKIVDSGGEIPTILLEEISKMADLGLITEQTMRKMLGLHDETMPSLEDITAAAGRYGIKLDDLPPKIQQLRINEVAKTIVDDFNLMTLAGVPFDQLMKDTIVHLTDTGKNFDDMSAKAQADYIAAGGKVTDSVTGMHKQIEDLVIKSMKLGLELPANMKPLLQAMADAGDLTDAEGNKMTDLSKLKFTQPIEESMKILIDLFKEFLKKIGDSITSIGNIPRKIPIDIEWNDPGFPNPHDGGSGTGNTGTNGRTAAIGGWVNNAQVEYLASGGPALGRVLNFIPKGTDTVPAMLTPGEGVVNNRGMSHLGLGGLKTLNSGGSLNPNVSVNVDMSELKDELSGLREDLDRQNRDLARQITRAVADKMAKVS